MSDERGGSWPSGAGRAGTDDGEARIGVVGDDDLLAAADAVATAEADPASADAIVAVGEAALASLPAGYAAPVLAVDVGGPLSVDRRRAHTLLADLAAGTLPTVEVTVAGVSYPGGRARVLFDAMLVTAEPARISEYSVAGDREVARFRADGIVVATPLGSHGYAADAGGPIITPGTDALAAVPVAPFAIGADRWVLSPPVVLRVERDEAPVELLADDRRVGAVPADEPVRIGRAGTLKLVAPDG